MFTGRCRGFPSPAVQERAPGVGLAGHRGPRADAGFALDPPARGCVPLTAAAYGGKSLLFPPAFAAHSRDFSPPQVAGGGLWQLWQRLLQLVGAGLWFHGLFDLVFESAVRNLRYTRSICGPAFISRVRSERANTTVTRVDPSSAVWVAQSTKKITTSKAFQVGDVLAALPVPSLPLPGHSFWSRQYPFNPVAAAVRGASVRKPSGRDTPLR